MIAWYPVQVFMGFLFSWLVLFFLSRKLQVLALSSKRQSASRLVRRKLLSVTSFW